MKLKHPIYLLCLLFAACSGGEVIKKFPDVENMYDPSRPKEVTGMQPLTGRIDNNFVIEGNLGDNIEDMRVYFDDKKAVLLRTDGQTLHGIIPKQPDGYNKITVVLGEDSIITDIEFRYRQVQTVSTITGSYANRKFWGDDQNDGSLAEATFSLLRGVSVVAGNSILVSEEVGRIRLVSQEDEKVVSLTGNWQHYFGDGAVNQARDEVYFIHMDSKELFRCRRSEGWSPFKLRDGYQEFTGKSQALTFGADERYLYLREHNGKFGRIDLEVEGWPFELLLETEPETVEKARICYSKMSDCFYYSSSSHAGISKVWQDKTTGQWKEERYAGYNGNGLAEGNRLTEAKFNKPEGLCADRDGNIYVTNYENHTIMKIWLKSGHVEHVAGTQRNGAVINGKPLESVFNNPVGIAMDDEDNFIIVSVNDGEIRKYSIE